MNRVVFSLYLYLIEFIMNKWITYLFLVVISGITMLNYAGCSKEDWKPYLKGNMVGYVVLFDEFGNNLDNHSGVKVTAIGLDRNYTAWSDAAGRFEIADLPTGTYEIHMEKEGFGAYKQCGVKHLGGQPTILSSEGCHFYLLCQVSTASIQQLRFEHDTIWADIHYTASGPDYINLVMFFSNTSGFTSSDAFFVITSTLLKSGSSYIGTMNPSFLPFPAASQVYFRASVYTYVSGVEVETHFFPGTGTYYDIEKQCRIYPNASLESNQYEFTMP